MGKATQAQDFRVSVILPANNESSLIGGCIEALLASNLPENCTAEVIVVANGCSDDTAKVAQGYAARAEVAGWHLTVIDREQGGKPGALNAGDAMALGAIRVYLDADVSVTRDLLAQLVDMLDVQMARYASGQVEIAAQTPVSRAYARVWRKVPFMCDVVPGCGLFAVNAEGRARWGNFPQIISDDIFVRLHFRPEERKGVPASYRWPIAEGWRNLIKVRRRQNAGVDEIMARYPDLSDNEDKPDFPFSRKLRLAVGDPLGFAVYALVALVIRLTPSQQQEWTRGR